MLRQSLTFKLSDFDSFHANSFFNPVLFQILEVCSWDFYFIDFKSQMS